MYFLDVCGKLGKGAAALDEVKMQADRCIGVKQSGVHFALYMCPTKWTHVQSASLWTALDEVKKQADRGIGLKLSGANVAPSSRTNLMWVSARLRIRGVMVQHLCDSHTCECAVRTRGVSASAARKHGLLDASFCVGAEEWTNYGINISCGWCRSGLVCVCC